MGLAQPESADVFVDEEKLFSWVELPTDEDEGEGSRGCR